MCCVCVEQRGEICSFSGNESEAHNYCSVAASFVSVALQVFTDLRYCELLITVCQYAERKCFAPVVCSDEDGATNEWLNVYPRPTCQLSDKPTVPANGQENEGAVLIGPQGPGDAEPQGPTGDSGPPGKVNYTAIQEMIRKQIEDDLKTKTDEKFDSMEKKFNAEIDKLRNDTNRRDLEATIDEKFQRLEKKVSAELEKSDVEIGKLRNDTTENSEKIEENRKSFGEIRNWPRTSCSDALKSNVYSWDERGGIVQISRGGKLYEVYCDITTDGGGWTTFQRRKDGSVDFYRTWEEYADGFGNKLGEFWLGLENIHQLTQDGAYELRVDLTDWDGSTAYAKYGTFSISGRSDNYRLTVGLYSGTAGDSMDYQNGRPFSAKNIDLDDLSGVNCATTYGGAWWYRNCAYSSLNGRYNDTSDSQSGVLWQHWGSRFHYSLKGSEMKFRKK